eukprot:1939668-Pyramimonas_sp.AAC.1
MCDSAVVGARRRGAANQRRPGGASSAAEARHCSYRPADICHGCQDRVGDDKSFAPTSEEMRLRDYVVDSVCCWLGLGGCGLARRRFEGVVPPGSASTSSCSVLGYSVSEFAPALAALTDHGDMVLDPVLPLVQRCPSSDGLARAWGVYVSSGSVRPAGAAAGDSGHAIRRL